MFYPERLTVARKRRGMTSAAVARASKLSTNSIHAYERSEQVPSDSTIKILSEVLGFDAEFFGAGDIEEFQPDGASFRALTSLTASRRDKALASGALAEKLSEWISEKFIVPEPDVPSLRGFTPEAAAEALRAEWGLGERPINNMVHLLESHGIRVFSLPSDCSSVDAFSIWRNEIPFIFLTTSKSGERGRMDAAHELGHLTLHKHGGPTGREAELQAQRFGSAFLMPRSTVLATCPRTPTLSMLISLKKNWDVAVVALIYRLWALDMITEWHYRTLSIEASKQGFRKTEPEGIARETSQVLMKVFSALREENVSRAAVARQLCIPLHELESLVFGLVITSIQGGRSISAPKSADRATLTIIK